MKSKIIFEDHEERKIIRRRLKNEEIIKLLAERDEYRTALESANAMCNPLRGVDRAEIRKVIVKALDKYPQQ